MLIFKERGKPEYPEKNFADPGWEPTINSTHIWRRDQESSREASALTTAPSKLPSNVVITDVWGKQTPILAETPSWKHIYILTIKLTITCDNFVASLRKLISFRPRDSSDTFRSNENLGEIPNDFAKQKSIWWVPWLGRNELRKTSHEIITRKHVYHMKCRRVTDNLFEALDRKSERGATGGKYHKG